MNKTNKIVILQIVLLIFLVIAVYFLGRLKNEVTYVRSPLNNKEYLVQNLDNKLEAAYMLSVIDQRITIFKNYLKNSVDEYPEYRPYIKQFCSRINNLVLQENAPNGNYTS